MKQKQVKAAPKVAKQAKKAAPSPKKKAAVVVEEVEEEPVEEKVVVAKKPANKKAAAKVQKKVVEEVIESPEEEEEEEDDEVEQDSEVEAEEEDDEEAMDEEPVDDEEVDDDDEKQEDDAEEDDEDDDEEDDEDDDEEDEDEEDDEEPTEAAIGKEPTIPSKVKSGAIPVTVPLNKIVHVKGLPANCQLIHIVQAFAKYGAIDQIHFVNTPSGKVANVAFKSKAAAEKAVKEANNKVKIQKCVLMVDFKKPRKELEKKAGTEKVDFDECRDRTIHVKFLKPNETEEEIRKQFAACGKIERCRVCSSRVDAGAYITFANKEAVNAAKKLHNSVLNGANIGVYDNFKISPRNPKLSVVLVNTQNIFKVELEKLDKIFGKCGEIAMIDIYVNSKILAIISFKTEEAAKKAMKMNGKTEQGIELSIKEFELSKKKTSIFVSNLPKECTEDDLRNLFSKAGEIASIILKPKFAIINFKDSDGYCKSFLYTESFIKNKIIFVEPNSQRKKNLTRSKIIKLMHNNNNGLKRPAENGYSSVFKAKKPKMQKTG